MKSFAIIAALLAAAPALGQSAAETAGPQVPPSDPAPAAGPVNQPRINQLIIYGDDPCPRSGDDITVCARVPESERYRIPENLRDLGAQQSNAWANKATELQYVGRTGTDSCSPVGAGGFTGCLTQMIKSAAAERQDRDSIDWNALIEQARQERLGQIDAKTEAIEEQVKAEERAPR